MTGGTIDAHASALLVLNYKAPTSLHARISQLLASKSAWPTLIEFELVGARKSTMVKGNCVNRLQGLQQNSAACYLQVYSEICSMTEAEFGAERLVRATDSDRHPSNTAGERLLRKARVLQQAPKIDSVNTKCQTHNVVQVHKEATDPMDDAISGILHIALTFDTAGSFQDFQTCVFEVALKKIRVREGTGRNVYACMLL